MAAVAVRISISQGPYLYLLNTIQIECVKLGSFDYDINDSYVRKSTKIHGITISYRVSQQDYINNFTMFSVCLLYTSRCV